MGIGGYRGEAVSQPATSATGCIKTSGAAIAGVGSYFADVLWKAPHTPPAGGVITGRDAVLEQ
jgi:hypothetical protein